MPKKINVNKLPTVEDFERHFGEMSGGGPLNKAGETILKGADFFANIFGMKTPLEKEDQAELNLLIQRKKEAKQIAEDKALGRDTQERITKMQIKSKEASDSALRSQLADQAAAELRENKRYHNNVAPPRIWKVLQGIFEPLWRNGAPYIILALVLITLIILLKSGFSKSKGGSRGSSYTNPIAKLKRAATTAAKNAKKFIVKEEHIIIRKIKKIFQKIIKFFEKIFHPFYKLRQFSNIVSGGGHDSGIERTRIESGRCDNMKWVETTEEGKKGQCDNAVHPIDLTWKIDNTKTPEYFDLPASRKSQIDKYSTVKIPWDVNPEASFYVPQCEKAYYPQTCKSNGICEKADMFEDLGLSCKPKDDKLPTQYPITEDKPALSFDDAQNKKCIDIHTLAEVPC
jgi:hypothetical protein